MEQEQKTIRHKGEKKFVVGRTYWDRSTCDYDTVFEFKVIARTAKRMTFLKHGKEVTKGIYEVDGVEHCKPNGTYSMCAVIDAEMYFAESTEPTEPTDDTAKMIRDAIEPLRSAAEDFAIESANGAVMRVIAWLHEGNADLNEIAPHVAYGHYDYDTNGRKRAMIGELCDRKDSVLARNVPQIMILNPTKICEFVARQKKQAGLDFDAFVEKLIIKIGKATKVELITSAHNPWLNSMLKCTMTDGSVEHWQTQMIINQSSLGKLFHQFPTRRIKNV